MASERLALATPTACSPSSRRRVTRFMPLAKPAMPSVANGRGARRNSSATQGPAQFTVSAARISNSSPASTSRARTPSNSRLVAQEPRRGDVVGDLGARIGRIQEALQEHPVGILHLPVVPCHAPGHPLTGDARDQGEQLLPREYPTRRHALGRRQVAVAIKADQVVHPQRAPERLPAARAVAVGRDHEAQGPDQVRGGAEPEAALGQGLPDPGADPGAADSAGRHGSA